MRYKKILFFYQFIFVGSGRGWSWNLDLSIGLHCFLLTPSNLLASSLSVKAARELQKEGMKETKIPSEFQLYFMLLMTILWREIFPGPVEILSRLPNMALKYICPFCWW